MSPKLPLNEGSPKILKIELLSSFPIFKIETLSTSGKFPFTIFLEAQDGEIEGIYNLEKKIIGVQFHMENKGVNENLTKQIMNKFFGLIGR